MHLNLILKKLLFVSLILFCASCSQENNGTMLTNSSKENSTIQVVNLSDYLPFSRGGNLQNSSEKVLKFKNENALSSCVRKLANMDENSRLAFFDSLNFNGAFTCLQKANCQLDSIFEINDQRSFLKAYSDFKNQYGNIFVYNDTDKYDLTPYLPSRGEAMNLIASKSGYVIVGNQLLTSLASNISLINSTRSVALPITPTFSSFAGNCSVVVSSGRFRSDISLGVERLSGVFMVRVASQKTKHFLGIKYTKRYSTDYHAQLIIDGREFQVDIPNRGKGVDYAYVVPILKVNVFKGRKINCSFKDFTSGCCSGTSNSGTFTVDLTQLNY